MAHTRYIHVDNIGQRGTISLLGARSKWEKEPTFIFLSSLRIAGRRADVAQYLLERGTAHAKLPTILSNAVTHQTDMQNAFEEMLELERSAMHRDVFLELLSIKSVKIVYPKRKKEKATTKEPTTTNSTTANPDDGIPQSIIVEESDIVEEIDTDGSPQNSIVEGSDIVEEIDTGNVPQSSDLYQQTADYPIHTYNKEKYRTEKKILLDSVKRRLNKRNTQPIMKRYGTLDYILE